MNHGFYLFIDEAGDEGIERIRPIDPEGSSEYFVLAGFLIRSHRYNEIARLIIDLKSRIGIPSYKPIHFRDLTDAQKDIVVKYISNIKIGIIAIVSNKLNMRGYRNKFCEAKYYYVKKDRIVPAKNNYFYNNLLRYMLETASHLCSHHSVKAYGNIKRIKIVMSHRKGYSYSQTKAYLHKLHIQGGSHAIFNNKFKIDFRSIDVNALESRRDHQEICLQLADCIASSIYRSVDYDRFKNIKSDYMKLLSPLIVKNPSTNKQFGYGFKLLPAPFTASLTKEQADSLRYVGYGL